MDFETLGKNRYRVQYDSWMDGGGTWFGQEYVEVIDKLYPNRVFKRCFEWCSGPGFIGFNILDHGLCSSLCMSDIYGPAIDRANETIKMHNLTNVVAYNVGLISALPKHERFDLVVSNPPHFLTCPGDDNYQRIAVDQNWTAHQEFFAHIGQYLLPNAVILLQENQAGSLKRAQEFESLIDAGGLEITGVFNSPNHYIQDQHTQIYYIKIRKK
jgi:methylase of polypeptide subunit release factors